MRVIEQLVCFLTFEENYRLSAAHYRVVDFLTLLCSNVGGEFGNDFGRIEYNVAQRLDERHVKRVLRCFFGLKVVQLVRHSTR